MFKITHQHHQQHTIMKESDILFHHGILISLYKDKENQNSSDLITQTSTNPGVRLTNVPTALPVRTSHCSVWSSFPCCTACSNVTPFPRCTACSNVTPFCLIVISLLHCLFERHTISPLHCLFERHTILFDPHFPAALPVRMSHHSAWSSFPCCTACSNVTVLFDHHFPTALPVRTSLFCLIIISLLHCLFERHTILLDCHFPAALPVRTSHHFPAALPVRTSHHSVWSSFPCCTACSNVTPFCLIVISLLHCLFERHTILLDCHFPAALPVRTSHHFPTALPVRMSHHSAWSSFHRCTDCSNVTVLFDRHFPAALPVRTSLFCLIVISPQHCVFG